MTSLHPHWQSTEDEQPVTVRARSTTPRGAHASRMVAAVVGMAVMVGIGFATFDGWPHFLGQISNPTPDITVHITGDGFAPLSVRVRPGQTIRWVNDDQIPHILGSDDLPTEDGHAFESPGLFNGSDFFYTIPESATAGTYTYISQTATDVNGTIVIESTTTAVSSSTASIAPAPAIVHSSASSSRSTTIVETTPSIAVNPHVVGTATSRGSTQATVTQHRPVANVESGPAMWIVMGLSVATIVIVTRKAFERV